MTVTAIVPAAGTGRRFHRKEKIFARLGGIPVVIRTIKALECSKEIDEIILLVRQKDIERIKRLLIKYRIKKVKKVLPGGKTRTESVFNGLEATKKNRDLILIHDGTRPFVTQDIIKRCIREAERSSASCTAIPVKPTLKFLDSRAFIECTPDRKRLWEAQTPQVFRSRLIIKAYKEAMKERIVATDDSSLVERLGKKVKIVRGSYRNIKITTPEDIKLAEMLLKKVT